MSWFSELVDNTAGAGSSNVDWNPGQSPLWTNTSADPTKGTLGKENSKFAAAGAGGAAGAGLGLAGGMAVGADPGLSTALGTILGAKAGWDSGDKIAKIPFPDAPPKNNAVAAPKVNTLTAPATSTVGNNRTARAAEETARSEKRMERPKNIEQTFNLEQSLNSKYGAAPKTGV